MEQLPCDCLRTIFNFIKDKDYINVISTSKYFRSLTKYNLKIMTDQYKLGKIIKVKNIFVFTNILYDYKNFDVTKIPHTITEITFCDEFNESFDKLCKFEHLTKINVGMYYYKSPSYDKFPDKINKHEILITIICNRVLSKLFSFNEKLYDNLNNSLLLIGFEYLYNSNYTLYEKTQIQIKNNCEIINCTIIFGISSSINVLNDYEVSYLKKNMDMIYEYGNYINFVGEHVDKILEYLVKLKKTICDKHGNIGF